MSSTPSPDPTGSPTPEQVTAAKFEAQVALRDVMVGLKERVESTPILSASIAFPLSRQFQHSGEPEAEPEQYIEIQYHQYHQERVRFGDGDGTTPWEPAPGLRAVPS